MKLFRTGVVAAGLAAGMLASPFSEAQDAGPWQLSGDLRVMYLSSWRDARDGSEIDSDTLGSRLRVRLRKDIDANWRFQTRFAATVEDAGNDYDFFMRPERDSSTGVDPGTSTFDEFFLRFVSADKRTEIRFGRMQSSLKLPLVTDKSLDRNQASNINIGWTDGVYVSQQLSENWKAALTGQYNDDDGNGTAMRGPLNFDDSGSRVSAFASLESDREVGPVFMRALTLTWYPDALAVDGLAAPSRQDYVAAAWKMAAGWDLASGMRLVTAGEVGYAFDTPRDAVLGLPGAGKADGLAWQLGADLVGFLPNQRAGIVFGEADAGWLISNDFRQNDLLAEFRWSWQALESLRVQFRARWREEQDARVGASRKQSDRDIRFRATYSL